MYLLFRNDWSDANLIKSGRENTINYIYIRKIKPLEIRKTGPIAQLGGAFD
jgi:hypothetical protein